MLFVTTKLLLSKKLMLNSHNRIWQLLVELWQFVDYKRAQLIPFIPIAKISLQIMFSREQWLVYLLIAPATVAGILWLQTILVISVLYVCFQFFKDKESKTKHWREIHLMNLEPTEAHQGSLKWIIYLCIYSFVMSMPTLLFCYDLNSDRPARPRLSALYIVTKLPLLMCHTPVTLITT